MSTEGLWIGAADTEGWRAALHSIPADKRDVYFEPEYVRLYENATDRAECFIYRDGGDTFFYPFLRQEIPCRPGYFDICSAYGYSGPLATTADRGFLCSALVDLYAQAQQKNVVAELIKFHPLLANQSLMTETGYPGKIVPVCQTVYVAMDMDEEMRWNTEYSHSNRKNINKSRRANVRFLIGQEERQWQSFLPLYAATMSANQAASFYHFAPAYFKQIRTSLADHYLLASALVDGRFAATLLVLLGPRYAHCHLIGTDRDFLSLGVNNFLHHELIQWCKIQGYRALHIGGGRTNADDDALLNFKKNFSCQTGLFSVGEHIVNPAIYQDICADWVLRNSGKESCDRLLKYRY